MRLKRALGNEQRKYGFIDDGAGKRYRIGPLFVLAGELQKAIDFFAWYEKFCAEDSGEPLHYFCWALALHRTGNREQANSKLLETMVQNIYLLPMLLGAQPVPYDMWHSSNREEPGYRAEIPDEYIPELSEEERSWIKTQLGSFRFRRVLDEYVSTYRMLKTEKNVEKRSQILKQWYEFLVDTIQIGR
jgi:hypothetical protein